MSKKQYSLAQKVYVLESLRRDFRRMTEFAIITPEVEKACNLIIQNILDTLVYEIVNWDEDTRIILNKACISKELAEVLKDEEE